MASSMSAFNCSFHEEPFCLPAIPCKFFLWQHPFQTMVFAWNNDRQLMLPAEVIAHVADIVIGLFAVVIFLMVNVISGAKNNVVVNVSSVYVRSDNIGVSAL